MSGSFMASPHIKAAKLRVDIDLVSDDDLVPSEDEGDELRVKRPAVNYSRTSTTGSNNSSFTSDIASDITSNITSATKETCRSGPYDKSLRSLNVGRMLNDDIVDFYMRHLMDKAPQSIRDKIHVFNCFFYQKFTEIYIQSLRRKPEVTPESITKKVRRWDKGVRIFDKDFLVIPVCQSLHWILVIVAYPGLVPPGVEQKVVKPGSKRSAILLFDSLRFKYMSKFTGFLRQIFLPNRWKIERPEEQSRNFASREMLTERNALVPRQKNYYDCGVHMLYAFDRFLKNPTNVYQRVMDVDDLRTSFEVDTVDMRKRIRSLLPEVIEVGSPRKGSADDTHNLLKLRTDDDECKDV